MKKTAVLITRFYFQRLKTTRTGKKTQRAYQCGWVGGGDRSSHVSVIHVRCWVCSFFHLQLCNKILFLYSIYLNSFGETFRMFSVVMWAWIQWLRWKEPLMLYKVLVPIKTYVLLETRLSEWLCVLIAWCTVFLELTYSSRGRHVFLAYLLESWKSCK